MASEKKRDVIYDGELEIIRISDDLHDEIREFYKINFLPNENVHKACNFGGTEQSRAEIDAVIQTVLQKNLGYVVRNCQTQEMIAFCINEILHRDTDPLLGFKFESPAIICGGEFVYRIKSLYNLFDEWNIDCALEIGFLSTRSDYGGRGLAAILSQRSIDFARQMFNGTVDEEDPLPKEMREIKPQAVCSIFTSLFTQKMGEKLGFETFSRIPFTELFYEGKSFAERIDPIHTEARYAGIRL